MQKIKIRNLTLNRLLIVEFFKEMVYLYRILHRQSCCAFPPFAQLCLISCLPSLAPPPPHRSNRRKPFYLSRGAFEDLRMLRHACQSCMPNFTLLLDENRFFDTFQTSKIILKLLLSSINSPTMII